jgi:hypothetical protein
VAITARPHTPAAIDDPAYQAYLTLRVGFVAAPILFGLDKFTNLLAALALARLATAFRPAHDAEQL